MADRRVVYWDASALVAVAVRDPHTEAARRILRSAGLHLLSSLAEAEFHAVLSRIARDHAEFNPSPARSVLAYGTWNRVNIGPAPEVLQQLAERHVLRGADLWHLGMATTLREHLPEIQMLTYDKALQAAAAAESLST